MLSTVLVHLIALQLQSKGAPPDAKTPPSKPPAPMTRPLPTKVLATVNGQPITGATVEQYLWDWKADEIIDTLVNFQIVDGEAKRLKLTVTPAEVQEQLNTALASVKSSVPAGTDVWQALKDKGYPPSRVMMTIRSSVLLDKIVALDFKPTDYVDVSTIIVKPKSPSAEDDAAAMKTAQGYYDQLTKGDDWLKVLGASTTDANIVKNQGRIGWRMLTLFPPDSKTELVKLKAGQATHPVKTPYGIQIFKLNAFGTTAAAADLKQMKDEFLQSHRNEVLTKLRGQAKIVKIK
jgi:parvulin-like peptidyl-prolyl isomerase